MSNLRTDSWHPDQDHPSSEFLFLAMERELDAREQERVQTHVESCWQCQAQWEKWREAANAFVGYRSGSSRSVEYQPPHQWIGFRQELRRIAAQIEECRPAFSWEKFLGSLFRPVQAHRAWALSALFGAALIGAALHFSYSRTAPVRAPEPVATPSPGAVRSSKSATGEPANSPDTVVRTAPGPERTAASPTAGESELETGELQARIAVAESGVDLVGQISIQRKGTTVAVEGVLDSPEARDRLLERLSRIDHVEPRVRAAGDVALLASPLGPVIAGPQASIQGIPPHPPLLDARLQQHFADKSARSRFVNSALDSSRTAMLRAWALRRLAERYLAEKESLLDSEQRRSLHNLIATYARALDLNANEEETALVSLVETQETSSVPFTPASWQETVLKIFDSVQLMDQASIHLLSETTDGGTTPETTERNFRQGLTSTKQLIPILVNQTEKE